MKSLTANTFGMSCWQEREEHFSEWQRKLDQRQRELDETQVGGFRAGGWLHLVLLLLQGSVAASR